MQGSPTLLSTNRMYLYVCCLGAVPTGSIGGAPSPINCRMLHATDPLFKLGADQASSGVRLCVWPEPNATLRWDSRRAGYLWEEHSLILILSQLRSFQTAIAKGYM